ncbi:MAG: pilus assembly protein PilM [Deltaproteobacteria bacterium]|nr:pilus assembly protein PilM [Deltaproteobacteria bacterium]
MAQRVLGIDLGAHAVKVAELEVGFRTATLAHLGTVDVVPDVGDVTGRSLEALGKLPAPGEGDGVAFGIPGERVLLRLLNVPATDAKKLQALIGNELADDIPWELEEVTYDHQILGEPAGKALVVATRSQDLREVLERLAALRIEPRNLLVSPLAYAHLVRRVRPIGTVVVLDLGHLRTNLCVVHDGRALAGRTISRAGHQLTEALRQGLQVGYDEAERIKEAHGVVSSQPDELPAHERPVAEMLGRALAPLVREIKQSLWVYGAQLKCRPEALFVCGGTSLLRGLDGYLAAETGLPVERLSAASDPELPETGLTAEGEAVGTLAVSLALGFGRRGELDFRQGEFAFKKTSSIFRDKLWQFVAAGVTVLLFAALGSYASLYALRKEEAALQLRLRRATREVFGEVMTNPKKVSRALRSGAKASGGAIPSKSAMDVFELISNNVPSAKAVKLDVTRLDIKPGKAYLTGTADSRSAIGEVVKALKDVKCFSDVATGTISEVGGEKKQFSLTITTSCF